MHAKKIVIVLALVMLTSCKQAGQSGTQSIDIKSPQWLSAVSNPDATLGNDKDHFINRTTDDVFEKIDGSWVLITNIKGNKGVDGINGADGSNGLDGKSSKWISGMIDPVSSQGNNGDFYLNKVSNNVYEKISDVWTLSSNIKGLKGDTGSQGIQGIQGNQGIQGLKGDIGSQGIQGLKGDTGSQGIQGLKGDTGAQGIQGVQGLKGDTGSQGIQGIQGNQGIQGLKGDTGAQGIQGLKGDNGLSTIAGKTVQTTSPTGTDEVLIYDLAQDQWISQKLDVSKTVGNINGSRVAGDIAGNANSITGFIEQVQVNGLGTALSNLGTQIANVVTNLGSTNTTVASHTTSISNLNTNKADKAYVDSQDSATLANAASDALTKATTAETNAKTYTDTKALAVSDAALTTAKSYADTQDAATLSSAASDASTKATTAETNAKTYADTKIAPKADKTYVDSQDATNLALAQSDATTKANAAESNAILHSNNQDAVTLASAASDASTKATTAETNAKTYADTTKLSLAGGTMTGEIQTVVKTTANEASSFGMLDRAKFWFNENVNRLKFWDGTTNHQIAVKTEVDLKANQAALDTTNSTVSSLSTNKADSSSLGTLAYKNLVTNSDISGTITDSHLAGISGSKVSGVIGGNIGDTVNSNVLTGLINGSTKIIGDVLNRISMIWTNSIDVASNATVGGSITGANITASTSMKVGIDDVLTTASTLNSSKLSNTTITGGVGSNGKIPLLNGSGVLDQSVIGTVPATSISDGGGRFLDTTIGTNILSTSFGIAATNGSFVINGIDKTKGLKVTNANFPDSFSQAASIDVGGTIVSRTLEISTANPTSLDFSKSNTIYLTGSWTATTNAIDLTGLVDGGAYTVIIKGDATARTFTFTANSAIATKTTGSYPTGTVKPNPAFAATDGNSKDTIYNIMVVRGIVYITWMSGF